MDRINFIEKENIVWYDPNIYNAENTLYCQCKEVSAYIIRKFSKFEDANQFLKHSPLKYHVITSGSNGEAFVQLIHDYPNVKRIKVFCGNIVLHKQWAKKYSKLGEDVFDDCSKLFKSIEEASYDDIVWNIMEFCEDKFKISKSFHAGLIPDRRDCKTEFTVERHLAADVYFTLFSAIKNQQATKEAMVKELVNLCGGDGDVQNLFGTYTDTLQAFCRFYSMERFFYKLNEALRQHRIHEVLNTVIVMISELKKQSKAMYRCKKDPLFKGVLSVDPNDYKPGKTKLYYPGFTSTSISEDVAKNFGNVIFVIQLSENDPHPNIDMTSNSEFAGEKEVLLLPYFAFEVTKKEERANLIYIYLKQQEEVSILSTDLNPCKKYWNKVVSEDICDIIVSFKRDTLTKIRLIYDIHECLESSLFQPEFERMLYNLKEELMSENPKDLICIEIASFMLKDKKIQREILKSASKSLIAQSRNLLEKHWWDSVELFDTEYQRHIWIEIFRSYLMIYKAATSSQGYVIGTSENTSIISKIVNKPIIVGSILGFTAGGVGSFVNSITNSLPIVQALLPVGFLTIFELPYFLFQWKNNKLDELSKQTNEFKMASEEFATIVQNRTLHFVDNNIQSK